MQCRLSAYNKCVHEVPGHTTYNGGRKGLGSYAEVNSEQVSFESFAEAGERLCDPDIGRELVPPLRSQNREKLRLS